MAQIKDLTRMCAFYNDCDKCPLSCIPLGAPRYLKNKADEIVDNWVKEHPVKTYAMDFFEKFPNALNRGDGAPIPCVIDIYGVDKQSKECLESKVDCLKCWNREMKENA